jgi:hypothetical protein
MVIGLCHISAFASFTLLVTIYSFKWALAGVGDKTWSTNLNYSDILRITVSSYYSFVLFVGQGASNQLARELQEADEEGEEDEAFEEEEIEEEVDEELNNIVRSLLVDSGLYLVRETEKIFILLATHTKRSHVSVDQVTEQHVTLTWRNEGPSFQALLECSSLTGKKESSWSIERDKMHCRCANTKASKCGEKLGEDEDCSQWKWPWIHGCGHSL